MNARHIIGIDLSGPANPGNTAVAVFKAAHRGLVLRDMIAGAGDEKILECVGACSRGDEVVVGLDAPLSYQPGGGDRPADSVLRREIIAAGLKPGSVMSPTLTRMVYLTVRGISVARNLQSVVKPAPRVVEVHPGATMVLRGAPADAVRTFSRDTKARRRLLGWLERQGLQLGRLTGSPGDHAVGMRRMIMADVDADRYRAEGGAANMAFAGWWACRSSVSRIVRCSA